MTEDGSTYGIRIQHRSPIPHIDPCQDKALPRAPIDLLLSLWAEILCKRVGEEHTGAFEPSDEMNVVDVLKLIVISPHDTLFPDRRRIVAGRGESRDACLHFVRCEDLR